MIESIVRIIRQKLGTYARRLDEPHEAIDLVMARQLDAINRTRADLVLVTTGEKRVNMLLEQFEEHGLVSIAAARDAKGRSDQVTAERAMRRALNAERLVSQARAHLGEIVLQRRAVESLLEQMRARYEQLRLRRESVRAMASAARAVSGATESMMPASPQGADREDLLQRAHDALADLRARSEALLALRTSGALDGIGASAFDDAANVSDEAVRTRLATLD